MSDAIELWEQPQAPVIYMIAGWRQWADAGSISSGLPRYLIRQTKARQIGLIRSEGFYLFQFPGTHDLVRPVVRFEQGYPKSLEIQHNDLYYAGNQEHGVVYLLGDEPHLDVERYVATVLQVARTLGVRRIVGLGGVYGEVPYDKERMVSSIFSLPHLRREVEELAVSLSDYQGGASIGSYLCKRAGEQEMEYVSFYAFVPTYDLGGLGLAGNAIRIENDFTAWLGVMRRINHMLRLGLDLAGLERRSARLVSAIEAKVDELESSSPQLGVRQYLEKVSANFEEVTFEPLDAVWEDEFRRLFDDEEEDGP